MLQDFLQGPLEITRQQQQPTADTAAPYSHLKLPYIWAKMAFH